jgi:hypothetical protein
MAFNPLESFMLLEPWWTLRTGSVPFWMKFNSNFSAAAIERYLDEAAPYDDVHVMLFAHGSEGIGLAPPLPLRHLLPLPRRPPPHPGSLPDARSVDRGGARRFHRSLGRPVSRRLGVTRRGRAGGR